MKRTVVLGFAFLGLALLAGCQSPAPGPRLSAAGLRPEPLLAKLALGGSEVGGLRSRAQVEIEAPDLHLSRPQRLYVARPEQLRVEVLALFGQLAAVLVAHDGVYQLYEPSRGELQEGLISASLLWRVARVDLQPREVVELLLGTPAPQAGLRFGDVRPAEAGGVGFDRLDARGTVRERYVFDAQGHLKAMERMDPEGAAVWQAQFDDYRMVPVEGGEPRAFAFELRLDFPRVRGQATLRFKQVSLSRDLPGELFELKLPQGQGGKGAS
ncbi:MAG: DUF4292 domain-containing protein [Myxococcota bacterium]|nr:DUF4292 domain-containing protein [Myxococcota bacterium]